MIAADRLSFKEIIRYLFQTENNEQLEELLRSIRHIYGLEHIVYHAVYLPTIKYDNPILLLTYDPAWISLYKTNNYFEIDPVVLSGTKNFLPLDWRQVDHESKSARAFFKEADRFGVGRNGITLPVRGSGGERALFTITSNTSDHEWETSRFIYMRDFQIIAHYFHDRAVQINGFKSVVSTKPLSRREMECLQLTAHGLVAKQIAGRLRISDSAVRLYLRTACNKLACASTNQAVAKLVALEIIRP